MICFGLVWFYINHCRLFNTKSIFIHMNSFISNNKVLHNYRFFASAQLNVKTVPFQTIQFIVSTQFQCKKKVPFQTIQFSISTEFQCKKKKQFHFKQFSLA